MKLNADIVCEHLPSALDARIDGVRTDGLVLSRPLLYEGGERPLRADTLYVVRAERLPQRARIERGAAVVCIGDSPRLSRLRDRCRVICVDERNDFYAVFNAVQGVFDAFDAWERDVMAASDEGDGISEMLTRSEELFGAELTAIDRDFKVVGASRHSELYASAGSLETIGYRDFDMSLLDAFLGVHGLSMEEGEPFVLEVLGTSSLNYNLYDAEGYEGCVTALYADRPFRETDKPLLAHLGSMVLRSLKQLAMLEADGRGTLSQAVKDLVEGYPLDSVGRALFERAARSRHFVCMRLKLGSRLANLPIGYIRNMVASAFPRCIAFEHHKNSVVAFVDLDELDQDMPYPDAIRAKLEPFTSTMGMSAGISDPVEDLVNARLYYLEANIALENGALFAPEERICSFQDHVLEDMVVSSLGELPLEMLCPKGLLRLVEHDRESPTSYVDTLSCFLDHNQSVAKTSAELYIHRSTLLERLARIRRELDLNLGDPDVVLRLKLLLKAMELRARD